MLDDPAKTTGALRLRHISRHYQFYSGLMNIIAGNKIASIIVNIRQAMGNDKIRRKEFIGALSDVGLTGQILFNNMIGQAIGLGFINKKLNIVIAVSFFDQPFGQSVLERRLAI
ncbi:hypothetical protein LJB99_00340 [Deltaproteobacteria bacterium OttesenSCG-928-K17]|nr:hypothetical protein [Deltaproteobacteria bacterium OttesenSCG-928-K17]